MVIAVGAVGAFIVGMIGIGTRPFWLDESFSYWFPRQSLNAFVDVSLHQELNMVAHYFVMGTWGRILDGAVGVRLFSVVCFAIGAAVIGLLARELYGSRAVIPAMILWIVNAPALRYAQEARGYMMATVAVTASALCLVRHIKSGRRRPLLGFALFGALSVYSHMFALLAMVGLCTAALWYAWPRQNRRVVVRGVTTFALLCVPLLVFLSQAETAQIGWVKYQHRTIQNVLEFLSGGGYERMLIVIACCGVGTYIWFQCRRNRRYVGFTYLLPAAWLIATVLGAFIINMKKPIILDRYFMVAAPAAVLVVAGQIARARVRRDGLILGTVAIVAVCLFSVRAIESTYKDHGTVNWNKVSAYVAQHSNGDDQLVVLPRFERSPFDFAWKDQGLRAEFLVPASPATEIGVMSNDAKTAGDVPIGTAARSKVLVVISPGEEPGFESELAKLAPMKMTHEENFGSITVREYSP